MLNYEEELKKFKPCLDVDEVEDAIYSRDLTDVIDILKEMQKSQTCLLYTSRINAEILGLMVKEPRIDPGELGRLRVRTLVIAGQKDMIKQSHTELIYKSLPDARLAIIPGDHFIAGKNPEAFNRTVEKFLNENPA